MRKIATDIKKSVIKTRAAMSDFHIDANPCETGLAVTIGGVKRVSEISDNLIEMKTSHGALRIFGSLLSVSVFLAKTIEVKGKIEKMEFLYGKI